MKMHCGIDPHNKPGMTPVVFLWLILSLTISPDAWSSPGVTVPGTGSSAELYCGGKLGRALLGINWKLASGRLLKEERPLKSVCVRVFQFQDKKSELRMNIAVTSRVNSVDTHCELASDYYGSQTPVLVVFKTYGEKTKIRERRFGTATLSVQFGNDLDELVFRCF